MLSVLQPVASYAVMCLDKNTVQITSLFPFEVGLNFNYKIVIGRTSLNSLFSFFFFSPSDLDLSSSTDPNFSCRPMANTLGKTLIKGLGP